MKCKETHPGSGSVNIDDIQQNINYNLPNSTSLEPHFKKRKVSTRRYNEDYLKYCFIKCEKTFEKETSVYYL